VKGEMATRLTRDEIALLQQSGYSEKAITLYANRTNVGVLEHADISLSNTGSCGDTMKFYLRITEHDVIEDATFLYLGCPGSASAGSAVTELAKGKTLHEAMELTEADVLTLLDSIPESKIHCAKLAILTLQKTIAKYQDETKASP
jgi:nitrogen fixation NifU-like protein